MSYTFRVIFDGVCAFVPDRPFFPNQSGGIAPESLAVMLPDLRKPDVVTRVQDLDHFRRTHFPLLKVDPIHISSETTRKIDLVCREINSNDEKALILLRREKVCFELEAENRDQFTYADKLPPKVDSEKLESERMPTPNPTDRDELESLYWLPRLSEISPTWNRVREDHLPDYPFSMPNDLAARIETSGGHLRVFDFNRDSQGAPVVWRFAEPNDDRSAGEWNRAIGNRLVLEFFDVQKSITIHLDRISNETFHETLVLKPPLGGSRSVLEVEISNREPEVLFGEQEEGSVASLPSPDFEEFYFKTCQVPDDHEQGRLVPYQKGISFFGPLTDPCSPSEIGLSEGDETGDSEGDRS